MFGTVGSMESAVQRSFDDLGTPLSQVTFVVVDVETTGGTPVTSSLTEVAAVRYRGGEMLGTYQTFVQPDERIPPFITALTGISDAMVADAPRVGAMLPSFLEFVGGAVLVGHNLRFDLSFLDHALVSTGREPMTNANVDTLALSRRLVRDMVPNCKLGTLAVSLRLPHQPSHRALSDVLATGDLLHALLERAGSFGIVGLEELLDLPRLVGHPQAAKLRLTVRLPHRPGVYWFTDAAGNVLYVGKATDLHTRVRSYFTGDKRSKVGRLLRQLDTIHHRICPGPLTAAVIEGRLIRQWSPPFNHQGKARRKSRGAASRSTGMAGSAHPEQRTRHPGRRRPWKPDELAGNPVDLLTPLADHVAELAKHQRYEEAASVRDEAERLRHLLGRHRRVASLRNAGRMILDIDGEGTLELDGGLLREADMLFGAEPDPVTGLAMARDGHDNDNDNDNDNERIIVAQWLRANADKVRILEVESTSGLSMPSIRIPRLHELCGPFASRGDSGGQISGEPTEERPIDPARP
jgi:DNA polymerase III epsilon subunit family exonuclease